MNYTEIEEKVKKFCWSCYEDAKRMDLYDGYLSCLSTAYGAIEFAASNLFPTYNEELAVWWTYKMRPTFQKAMNDCIS